MNRIRSITSAIRTLNGLQNFEQSSIPSVREQDGHYEGLSNEDIPLKIFHPKNPTGAVLILYPGASPKGEAHPKMIALARSMAVNGIQVYIPRIPPLLNLKLSKSILDWTIHFYRWLKNQSGHENSPINLAGISFGGVIVLKACLDPFLLKQPPKSIMVFGTSYDVRTSMKFMYNGRINYNGNIIRLKPDPWSVIVLFHNYLNQVDVGYPTNGVQKVLQLMARDQDDQAQDLVEDLVGKEKVLIKDIIELNLSNEFNRIMDKIFRDCAEQIEYYSPKYWCKNIRNEIYIMHGRHDTLSPFTESIKLNNELSNSHLLISGIFKHRTLSNELSIYFKWKEILKIILFLSKYFKRGLLP